MEFSLLDQIARGIDAFLGSNEVEAEVLYGELVKVSSKKHEIIIEYKEGGEWLRRAITVPVDWGAEDWQELADSIGEEGRFFLENNELDDFEFEE